MQRCLNDEIDKSQPKTSNTKNSKLKQRFQWKSPID